MQFTTNFALLAFSLMVALVPKVAAGPAPVVNIVSDSEFEEWLKTTDAEITWIGQPYNGSVPRAATNVRVTYCNKRTQNVCGGTCATYNGPGACLKVPGTACLSASANVGFCDGGSCNGSCNQLSSCGTRLDNGFCYTPGTDSIIVPPS